jgi:hypothetical protein
MAVTSAATEAIFGCEPRELSLLCTVYYIAASGNEDNQPPLRDQLTQHMPPRGS